MGPMLSTCYNRRSRFVRESACCWTMRTVMVSVWWLALAGSACFIVAHAVSVCAGRYEDEVTAAKAYDKAVVCLYGGNAITNFGLEQCLADPTEVQYPTHSTSAATLHTNRQHCWLLHTVWYQSASACLVCCTPDNFAHTHPASVCCSAALHALAAL